MFEFLAALLQRVWSAPEPVVELADQPAFQLTLVDGDVVSYPSTDIKITQAGFVYTKVKGRWVHTPDIVRVVFDSRNQK
jgi:hypothetical protein